MQLTAAFTFGTSLYYFQKFNVVNTSDVFFEVDIDANYQDGEMREVQVGPGKQDIVVVAKVEGKYYCVQGKCSHFGAPMARGVLFNDKITCPFHNAAFSVIDGFPEQGPVFDGLQTYEITEKDGKLHIRVPKDKLNKNLQIPMSTKTGNDPRRFVIVGGGTAAQSAAESLRQGGFEGEIIMITDDAYLPYDKTILSKNFTSPLQSILIRSEDFYKKYGIDVFQNTKVTNIDFDNNQVQTDNGKSIKYERLLLATGGSARRPSVQGVDLNNVHVLRNYHDAQQLQIEAQKAKQVVIVGASFIGCEFASSIKQKYPEIDVTVIDSSETPFYRVLGRDVGRSLQTLHENKGIQFKLQSGLQSIEGNNRVQNIVLKDGTTLNADFVLLGTGIYPNTQLGNNKLNLSQQNGGFEVDAFLRTNYQNVYAAGDCASFPYWYTGQRIRTEHYSEAIKQGSVAAYNMLGKNQVYNDVPFFWTRHYDKSLQYTGYGSNYDDVYITGDLSQQSFMAYYINKNKIVAAAGMGQGTNIMVLNEAMRLNVMPTGEEIKSGQVTVKDIQQKVIDKQPASKCSRANCCKNKQ